MAVIQAELLELSREDITRLVEENDIGENFNYEAEFIYPWYKEAKLVGLVAYMLQKDQAGNKLPRFIHVILDKEVRRSKEAYTFVMDSFRDLKYKGYDRVVAVIPHWKKFMIVLAYKFKFKQYASDEQYGYWLLDIDDLLVRKEV